jgi:hypothetical protein
MTPLVWAVNGSASVLGSVAVILLAVPYGFTSVQALAGVTYLLALLVSPGASGLRRS